MPAPVTAIAILGKTRTGRRIVIGAAALLLVTAAAAVTPLAAIPFAIAGNAVPTTTDPKAGPVVAGDWGLPLAGS